MLCACDYEAETLKSAAAVKHVSPDFKHTRRCCSRLEGPSLMFSSSGLLLPLSSSIQVRNMENFTKNPFFQTQRFASLLCHCARILSLFSTAVKMRSV